VVVGIQVAAGIAAAFAAAVPAGEAERIEAQPLRFAGGQCRERPPFVGEELRRQPRVGDRIAPGRRRRAFPVH
jgi:hypothetical protein